MSECLNLAYVDASYARDNNLNADANADRGSDAGPPSLAYAHHSSGCEKSEGSQLAPLPSPHSEPAYGSMDAFEPTAAYEPIAATMWEPCGSHVCIVGVHGTCQLPRPSRCVLA